MFSTTDDLVRDAVELARRSIRSEFRTAPGTVVIRNATLAIGDSLRAMFHDRRWEALVVDGLVRRVLAEEWPERAGNTPALDASVVFSTAIEAARRHIRDLPEDADRVRLLMGATDAARPHLEPALQEMFTLNTVAGALAFHVAMEERVGATVGPVVRGGAVMPDADEVCRVATARAARALRARPEVRDEARRMAIAVPIAEEAIGAVFGEPDQRRVIATALARRASILEASALGLGE